MTDLIKGTVAGIRLQKPNGWTIASLAVNRDFIPIVGVLPADLMADDVLEVAGGFKQHAAYGKQFEVSSVISHLSSTRDGIFEWIQLRLPNIGPVRAKALLDRFGSHLWGVIERNPKALLVIDGITEERVAEIVKAYNAVSAERESMIWLINLGLNTKQAAEVLKLRLSDLQVDLAEDPYLLASCRNISFEDADRVAINKLKYPKTGQKRVFNFTRAILNKALQDGDCYQIRHSVVVSVATAMQVPQSVVKEAWHNGCPGVVFHGKKLLLEDIDADEAIVAGAVRELLEVSNGSQSVST